MSIYFVMNDPFIRNYGTQSTPSTTSGQVWVVRQLAIWNLITELDQTPPLQILSSPFHMKRPDFACRRAKTIRTASSPTTSEVYKLSLLI